MQTDFWVSYVSKPVGGEFWRTTSDFLCFFLWALFTFTVQHTIFDPWLDPDLVPIMTEGVSVLKISQGRNSRLDARKQTAKHSHNDERSPSLLSFNKKDATANQCVCLPWIRMFCITMKPMVDRNLCANPSLEHLMSLCTVCSDSSVLILQLPDYYIIDWPVPLQPPESKGIRNCLLHQLNWLKIENRNVQQAWADVNWRKRLQIHPKQKRRINARY